MPSFVRLQQDRRYYLARCEPRQSKTLADSKPKPDAATLFSSEIYRSRRCNGRAAPFTPPWYWCPGPRTQKESYSAFFLRRSTTSPPKRTAANTQMIRTIEASIVVLLLPAAQRLEKP